MRQKENKDLPSLSDYRYENFFNIYQDDFGYYYNLLRSINIFASPNPSIEESYSIKPSDTWAYISYKFYNTIDLWWLICTYNQIQDASKMPDTGTVIKILKLEYVGFVLNQLNEQTYR